MNVREKDRRKRAKRGGQLWRHLRAAVRLVVRHPLMSVTVLPVREDGRIVMVRRVDSDRWVLPGGLMDWGEMIEVCGVRELEEETGLKVVRTGRLVGVYSSPDRDPRSHSVTVLMEAEVSGEPRTGDPLEISEIHAFTPDELPFGNMALGSDAMLRDYLAGRTVIA